MKRIFRSLAALLIIVISFSAISFAWLASGKHLNFPSSFGGSATPAYFAGGDGTEDNPFRITNAVHLYNLAWLQYLGYFNRREGFNNGLDQTYFELGKDVDMRGRAIPPIGTEEYPFIGEFKGNGHKVTNLTISNKKGTGDLVFSPTNANFSSDNMLCRINDSTKTQEIEIVGMFGVTGNYNGYLDTYAPAHSGFTMADVNVSNFYVDKIHVRSNSAKTLAGLAAGYIGGNFSNVGVYRSDIKFAANAQANGVAGEGVLSKYSLVGAYNEDLITWDDNVTGTGTWGGSIDMQRIYNRVKYAKDNHLTSYTYNSYPYNYYNGKTQITESDNTTVESKIDGSYYVRQGGTVYYLWGKQQETQEQVDSLGDNIFGGFKLTANGRNLFVNLSTEKFFMMGNDNFATVFYIEQGNSDYYMFIYKNSDKYYVRRNESTLTLTKNINNASKLTLDTPVSNDINNTKIAFDGKYFQHVGNVNYNMVESSSSATLFKFTKQPVYKTVLKYEIEENGGIRSTQTYFPINTETEKDKNGNIIKNTGYFASGSDDGIRMDIHNYPNNGEVYTINSNGKVEQDSTDVDFKKVKEECSVLQSGNGNGYGLHFMNAAVDTNNLYTIPNAKIKDTTYINRQMVANSVDFKVEQKGAIRFVAGTGYKNNNSFFALYNIFRSEEDDNIITDIKEISEIYYSSGGDYVYLYTDGTTSSGVAIPTGSELKFNCKWITNPGNNLINDTLYYFAIPVNKGEYALGSRSDLTGAYLFYLDIGANNNGEGPGEVNYTMDKVRFVNSSMPLDGGNVNVSAYKPALITLSGSSTAEEIAVFKRDEQETEGKLKLAYRIINNNANAINVSETTTGMTRKDTTLTPSTDDEQ